MFMHRLCAALLFAPAAIRTTAAQMSMSDTSRMNAMMTGPLGIPMDRMGSGTTWIPDAVSLPSRHATVGKWDVMLHGFIFGQYDKQGAGSNNLRGAEQWGSLNWAMVMASHDVAGGRLQFRTMLSLDPLGVTSQGYPLLLQSGESYHGVPLHDRQHPHDFWMELGALYERAVAHDLGVSLYVAPSGEPALGPVAFMHRPSAMDDPVAPIGHHWQDATHISFGVITAGIFARQWKIEGSVFNGREPDDRRWDFDPIKLDSYAGRLTVNPGAHWSFTAGYGYLRSPDALDPTESIHRFTASALHGTAVGADGQWATTLIYGANATSTGQHSNALLAESELIADRFSTFFGRMEYVEKSAAELSLPGFSADHRFNISSIGGGYIRELARLHGATLGVGVRATVNFIPSDLEPFYGSRTPVGGMLFLRVRPYHAREPAMTGMPMGTTRS
jgi:hypothetical protein